MADRRAVRVRIGGHVQGVGFRAWLRGEATRLGLSGWVLNRPDGDVEAVLSGQAPAVSAMIELCRRGPRHALVERVEEEPADLVAGPFEVRRRGFP